MLRHTFASHLIMRGRSIKEVQELLGHSDIKMTMRYAHLAPEVKREAVMVLDQPAGESARFWGTPKSQTTASHPAACTCPATSLSSGSSVC